MAKNTFGAVLSGVILCRRVALVNPARPPKTFLNFGACNGRLNFAGRLSITYLIRARAPASGFHFPALENCESNIMREQRDECVSRLYMEIVSRIRPFSARP
jgi:hypothetical protein